MKTLNLQEQLKQPLPIMKQKKYQVLYKLMLKNHMLKTQNQVLEAPEKQAVI